MNATHAPKFWEMGEYAFEDFCRALWLEEGVLCQKYGVRGQSQEGIDLITYNQPPGSKSVAQCKCYEAYTGADLKEAADKFFKHLAIWKKQKVRVFRLYVACSCAEKGIQTEYTKQRDRFETENIEFELHDDGLLVRAARPHPAIVAQYCTDAWVKNICGGGALSLAPMAVMATATSLVEGGLIFAQWETDRDSHLESIREKHRSGEHQEAYDELLALTRSAPWKHFSPSLRGKTLRLLAALELDRAGDVAAASAWVDSARNEDALGNFQVVDALLAYYERGPDAGLLALAAPKTVEAWNLQLALRLVKGESREVIAELDAGTFPLSVESNRLRALALLFQCRVAEALTEIDAVTAVAPKWFALRETRAVVYYASSISTEFHAWEHLAWPVPADWIYLKSDDSSLSRLKEAATQFTRLLDELSPSAPNHPDLETWKVGALASHPDTQGEAAQFVQALIAAHPDHYRVVIWAMERGYAFEHGPVRAALGNLAAAGNAPHDAVIAAINLAALDEDYGAARDLLNQSKAQFAGERGEYIWRFMAVQVFGGLNDRAAAEAIISQESEPTNRMRLHAACERILARHTRDSDLAVNAVVSIYEETKKGGDLLEAAGAKLHAGDVAWILDHKKELLDTVRTGGALRLVLSAAERTHNPELCLTLLDENRDVFRSARLPSDLTRLEVRCLRAAGRLAEAARRATALVADDGRPENALEQFGAQITMGDLAGATVTARLLVGADELPAEALLEAAAMITLEDRVLAVNLWEAATRRTPLSDRAVVGAVQLGFRLGLEDRLTDLMREMPRIAAEGKSGVTAAPIEEVVENLARQQERNAQAAQDYDAGNAPVHVFAEVAGWKLAVPYHAMLAETARAQSPLREPTLLARHGSREFEPTPILPPGQTVIDITALLLAEHIDILDLVEKQFGPLRISAWLPTSLNEQLQSVQPHQPEVDADRELTLQLVKDGTIGVFQPPWPPLRRADDLGQKMGPDWCAQLERVTKADGLLVDFFPLTAHVGANIGEREIVVLPQEECRRVIPVGLLLEGMQRSGALTSDDLQRCVTQLGTDAAMRGDPPLEMLRGKLVFLDGIMAERLARGGVLTVLSAYCHVEISQTSLDYLEKEVASAVQRRNLAQWLQRLLDRVARGINDGQYVSFTQPLDPALAEAAQNVNLRCLHDLLPREGEQATVVWCDDRYVNRNRASTAGPVLSTMEILGALRNARALTDEQYFGKLLDLRRANVRYLPVTSEELLYHMRAARIDGETIEETPALGTLRMSIAAALRETRKVQLPAEGQFHPQNFGELRWVFDLEAAIAAAMSEFWKENEPTVAAARSEWLIEMLHFDAATLIDLYKPGTPVQVGVQPFLADTLRGLVAGFGLSRSASPGDEESPRKRYFHWWYERIVEPVLAANPESKQPLGDMIMHLLNPTSEKEIELGMTHRVAAQLAISIYADLPEAVQEFTTLPVLVREEFGIPERENVVAIAGHPFVPTELWRAVAEAINGREAHVRDIKHVSCTLHPGAKDDLGCCALSMTVDGTSPAIPVSTTADALYHEDEAVRLRFLSTHPEYFDLPAMERQDAIKEIARLPEPAMRVARLNEYKKNSAEYGFLGLASILKSTSAISLANFFPEVVDVLPRHLRLDPFAAAHWSDTAHRLLADETLHETTLRLGTLPRRLPDHLLEAWNALASNEFSAAFSAFTTAAKTPILKLHLFHLAAERASKDETYFPVALETRDALMASSAEFTGFLLLLRWTFERLRQHTTTARWSLPVFISATWNYAARLHNILLQADTPAESIQGHAESLLAGLPTLLEIENRSLYLDAASARNVQWPTFLTRGLGEVVQTLPAELQIRVRPAIHAFESSLHSANESRSDDVFSQLSAETSTRANALASFLGGVWEVPLLAVIPSEVIEGWSFNTPLRFATKCLDIIENDTADCAAWFALWNGTGDAPVHASQADRVGRLLDSVDLTSLLIRHEQSALGALMFCCAQARFHGSAQTLLKLEQHLLQYALHCHVAHGKREGVGIDSQIFRKIARRMCEATYLLRAGDDKAAAAAPFCELAAKLIQACPAFGTEWRSFLGATVPPLPFGLSKGMWNLFLSLRAAP